MTPQELFPEHWNKLIEKEIQKLKFYILKKLFLYLIDFTVITKE